MIARMKTVPSSVVSNPAARVVRLVAVVELLQDALGELGDDPFEPDLASHPETAFTDTGQLLDDPEVGLGLGLDARALHLDGDQGPIVESGLVDLGRRRRRERDRIERLVQLFWR